MNDDIHRRALAAAVRLSMTAAWGTALVVACEPAPQRSTSAPPTPRPVEQQPAADPYGHAETVAASDEYGAQHRVDPLPATMSCEERLKTALPHGTQDFAGTRDVARRTQAVVSCCAELLRADAMTNDYFYECCGIARGQIPDADVPQSCSPWGPAVPPSIDWVRARGIT